MAPPRTRWRLRTGLGVALIACLALLALGAIGLGAARRTGMRGPSIALSLGEYHLIGRATTRPECLPLTPQECFSMFPMASVATGACYCVWAGRISQVRTPGPDAVFTVSKGWHVLRIPLN
jgi:hypothetical protein